jgi:hypothetical protein
MWKPTLRQLEIVDDMARAGMAGERIAAALGISPGVYTAWGARLRAARELDSQAVENLLYPPRPVAAPPPPKQHDPRIVAERIFEGIS